MAPLLNYLKSSILSKVVMASTGVVLLLFLLGHMIGNTQMYLGQEKMNHYAETLQGLGGILWVIRSVLFICFVLHVVTSIRLKFLNMDARPVPYKKKEWVKASLTSRTMLWSGVTIGLFLVYHIMHFTTKNANPAYAALRDALGRPDVYSMVIFGYQNVLISLVYLAAMTLLGFHLNHATLSAFQTLGVNHEKYNTIIHTGSIVLSLIIVIGFASVPLGVLAGIIAPIAGGM